MVEGAAVSLRAVAVDDRCRSLQALQRHTYGHPEGDACLTRIGEALAGVAGDTLGFAGRYGGEEFCLLLPNTSPQRASEVGETVRATVQGLGLPHITSSYCTVTVSVGVAATLPNDAQTPGDLIEAADAALYAAKHRGRNTVVEHGFAKLVDETGMAMAGWADAQMAALTSPTR